MPNPKPNRFSVHRFARTSVAALFVAMAMAMVVTFGASTGCTWRGVNPLMVRKKDAGDQRVQPRPADADSSAKGSRNPRMTDSADAPNPSSSDALTERSNSDELRQTEQPRAVSTASNASPTGNRGGMNQTGAPLGDDAPGNSLSSVAVVGLTFDVMNVEMPAAGAESSARLWKHIDESNADPSLPALLARNGVRIGVADENNWPALRSMFEQGGARTSRDQFSAQPGYPALINVGPLESGGMYFLHRRGGKVEGGTFDEGDRVVRLDYEIPPDDPSLVLVRVTLEARCGADRRFVRQGGEVRELAVRDGESFGEMACSVRLTRGQYLVLGSAENANTGFRIGSWWFRAQRGKSKFESLLCIRPDPVRIQ